MLEGSYQLGLSDLLDQNLSCYEYYHSLPEEVQKKSRCGISGPLRKCRTMSAAWARSPVAPPHNASKPPLQRRAERGLLVKRRLGPDRDAERPCWEGIP